MSENRKYRSEAKLALPDGYCVLAQDEPPAAADLVWSYTSRQWLRADSPEWLFSPLIYTEEIICVARKIGMSDYERSVARQRSYTISSL